MLHIIRNNSPYTVFILVIFTFVVKLPVLLHPLVPAPVPGLPLYNLVLNAADLILRGSAFGYALLAMMMVFLQGLYLNTIVIRQKLVSKPTHIPVFTLILLTSLSPASGYFSNFMLVNWCMLGALDMITRFASTANTRKYIFNAGLLTGMAAFFHFAATGYILLLIFALATIRSFHMAEWIVMLMGLLAPAYFIGSILFLTDSLPLLAGWTSGLAFPEKMPELSLFNIIFLSGMTLVAIAGLYAVNMQVSKAPNFVRRTWGVIAAYWVLSVLLVTAGAPHNGSGWLLTFPALSLIASQPMFPEHKKRFSNIILWLLLLLLILCQII